MPDGIETHYTVEEIAAQLGISIYTVRRLIKAGELPAMRYGGRAGYRVAQSDLEAFIRRRRAASTVDQMVSAVTRRP